MQINGRWVPSLCDDYAPYINQAISEGGSVYLSPGSWPVKSQIYVPGRARNFSLLGNGNVRIVPVGWATTTEATPVVQIGYYVRPYRNSDLAALPGVSSASVPGSIAENAATATTTGAISFTSQRCIVLDGTTSTNQRTGSTEDNRAQIITGSGSGTTFTPTAHAITGSTTYSSGVAGTGKFSVTGKTFVRPYVAAANIVILYGINHLIARNVRLEGIGVFNDEEADIGTLVNFSLVDGVTVIGCDVDYFRKAGVRTGLCRNVRISESNATRAINDDGEGYAFDIRRCDDVEIDNITAFGSGALMRHAVDFKGGTTRAYVYNSQGESTTGANGVRAFAVSHGQEERETGAFRVEGGAYLGNADWPHGCTDAMLRDCPSLGDRVQVGIQAAGVQIKDVVTQTIQFFSLNTPSYGSVADKGPTSVTVTGSTFGGVADAVQRPMAFDVSTGTLTRLPETLTMTDTTFNYRPGDTDAIVFPSTLTGTPLFNWEGNASANSGQGMDIASTNALTLKVEVAFTGTSTTVISAPSATGSINVTGSTKDGATMTAANVSAAGMTVTGAV
jgi:hypothetical protein